MKTHLFRENLNNIRKSPGVQIADESVLRLPEKVLQFGSGVLLRGLADYFIDKANRQGIFNGRVVIVKTTEQTDIKTFAKQNNLYTIYSKGYEGDQLIEETTICTSISRVLSAKKQWSLVLDCAKNPNISIVISNTTELGIQLVQDDIYQWPPVSYPGKLLAFLYARFVTFGGRPESGLVIIPTELIHENGSRLEAIVMELAHRNGLESSFIDWLEKHNTFCNSIVDRIIPGLPEDAERERLEAELGYRDDLMIVAEHYRLWAIEGDESLADKLGFVKADSGIVVSNDINQYLALKLNLLNGTHTLCAALAHLCDIQTVRQAMEDPVFSSFIINLMQNEIARTIPYSINPDTAQKYSEMVLDRFRNKLLDHKWQHISYNYSAKMEARVVPILLKYIADNNALPEYVTFGMAAFILLTKPVRKNGASFPQKSQISYYLYNEENAAIISQHWHHESIKETVSRILSEPRIWGINLSDIPGLQNQIVQYIKMLMAQDPYMALTSFINKVEFV